MSRHFASDNNAGIQPEILQAIADANVGHAQAYGADSWTARAEARFRELFGAQSQSFLVFNGTGANVLSLSALTRSYHAVICADLAHIEVDECGAPEKFTGCKLVRVPAPDGKLTPASIEPRLGKPGDQHHVQSRVISITQSTEYGTVYTPEEIRALSGFAHQHGLYLHLDGARISNAAASLGIPVAEFTREAGVDVLSFGGTKNGLLGAEAVVFLNPELAHDFKYVRKQGMQLASKMRFAAAQFLAFFQNDLWLKSAAHANRMASLLAREVSTVPGVRITQKVEANAVFATLPESAVSRIQERYFFYLWNEAITEARWMCSFDTTEEDVAGFAQAIREACVAPGGTSR